jgi:F-type H+-transporting ATPase subunit epsilon
MASNLSVRVVSPAKEVFNGEAASLVAPAWDGMVGILPGHAPMIALLGHGELAVDVPGGGSQSFYVAGGVMKVEVDEVTVLTEYAGDGPPEVLPPEATLSPEDLLASEAATDDGGSSAL